MPHVFPFSLLSCCALLTLISCAAPLNFGGPYSDLLNESDVQQIKLLVSKRPDIRKPVSAIWVNQPDSALVQTGRQSYRDDLFNQFTVARRHGRWEIVSKIQEGRCSYGYPYGDHRPNELWAKFK